MAEYLITVYDKATMSAVHRARRYTFAAAFNDFELRVYNSLAAFGKLDTIAAHKAMGEARRARDLLPVGDYRCVTVSNTGQEVLITRVS